MKILPEPLFFEWDKGNSDKNLVKHQVAIKEAEEIFDDKSLLVSEDIKHSEKELRFQALGKTNAGRVLFVSFTIRKNRIRIISVRDMNRKEEIVYEKT